MFDDAGAAPVVSAILIFLNARKFIAEAIESVFAQTFGNWELILVDDGSSDGSTQVALDYAHRFPQKVRYLQHEGHVNRGAAASRNLGVDNAKGHYLAPLDADDVWLSHKLGSQVAILEANPGVAMVFGSPLYWHSWGTSSDGRDYVDRLCVGRIKPNSIVKPPTLLTILHPLGDASAPCPSDLLFRKNLIGLVGGFENSFTGIYQLCEDQAFLSKVYLAGEVFVSDECWIKYRIHSDSCCATVMAAGHYDKAHLFFLNWLRSYLQRHEVSQREIWLALQNAYRRRRYRIIRTLDPRLICRRAKRFVAAKLART